MPSLPETNFSEPDPVGPTMVYRTINPLAVVSVVLGGLSFATALVPQALAWMLVIVPLAGILSGWRALSQIAKAPTEWAGRNLACWGIALSIGLWGLGMIWQQFAHRSRVPFGYDEVKYEMLQPNKVIEPIPQTALDMRDKKVYIEGYMQPRRRQTGIKDFILCPTNGECPFCIPNPKVTEKIRIILPDGMEAAYTTHLIGVAGRFRVDLDESVPYGLEADQLRQ